MTVCEGWLLKYVRASDGAGGMEEEWARCWLLLEEGDGGCVYTPSRYIRTRSWRDGLLPLAPVGRTDDGQCHTHGHRPSLSQGPLRRFMPQNVPLDMPLNAPLNTPLN